jgi:type II secretory pathway component PulL
MEPSKPPLWLSLMATQIHPADWCIPVEDVWRRAGWVPPSRECPATIAKQQSFRTWTVTLPAGETIALNQLPASEAQHG